MRWWRHTARWLWAHVLRLTGCLWWAKRCLRQRRGVSVLMFHRVLSDSGMALTNSTPGMLVRAATFAQLVAHCVRSYEVVAVGRFDAIDRGARPAVAFTFDDGWGDTFESAYPVLARHRAPFSVFVCPWLVGRDQPFWPERTAAAMKAGRPTVSVREIETAIERMKAEPEPTRTIVATGESDGYDSTMTWAEIEELDQQGVTIGSHTNSHSILTSLDTASARAEIAGSKRELERVLGKRCTAFSYPNGNHNGSTRSLVAEAGFEIAFTTKRGAWTPSVDQLAVPRSNICEDNVVGPWGNFSPTFFEYFVFWNGWRASSRELESPPLCST